MEPPSCLKVVLLAPSDLSLDSELIERASTTALRLSDLTQGEVCINLTDDASVRSLNREFRGVDEDTDVLTFPAGDDGGDIAISVPYATRQAALRGVSASEEVAFLAIHGVLHLAGYDDQTERDRANMVARMNVIAEEVGLAPDHEWHSRLHEAAS